MLLSFFKNKYIVVIVIGAAVVLFGISLLNNKQPRVPATPNQAIPGRPPELPKLAPVDFPVYPKSEVIRMESMPPTDFAVVFASQDKPAPIYQYLLKNAVKNGWQVIQQTGAAFRVVKNKTTVTILVSQQPGEKTAILEQVKLGQ